MSLKKLQEMLDYEKQFSHVEGFENRMSFINIVMKRYGIDPVFDKLVDTQFSMWCDNSFVEARTFVETCNNPVHKIRNMLIVWDIDHKPV